jgi:hypothetical protein
MKKHLLAALCAIIALPTICIAKEKEKKDTIPRGYSPIAEVKEVQTKAASSKKLVVLCVKGKDDACPRCATALENGEKAIGSGVIKLFARAEDIQSVDSTNFSAALKARVQQGFTGGASVTFVVFNPEMDKIIAEAGRDKLEDDKAATAEFKKQVQEAKKSLK